MTIAFGLSASLADLLANQPAADPNQVGRFFFATDTHNLYRDNGVSWDAIGRSYRVYTALLYQDSFATDPVATVLENTLGGTVVWTRSSTGVYLATLAGAFPFMKCFGYARTLFCWLELGTTDSPCLMVRQSDDQFGLFRFTDVGVTGFEDGLGGQFEVEIRVYP